MSNYVSIQDRKRCGKHGHIWNHRRTDGYCLCGRNFWVEAVGPIGVNMWTDTNLIFYQRFPKNDWEVRQAMRGYLSGKRITEKGVLSVLRHYYTNYDNLLYEKKWQHDTLKKRVNQLILEKIGTGWLHWQSKKEVQDYEQK